MIIDYIHEILILKKKKNYQKKNVEERGKMRNWKREKEREGGKKGMNLPHCPLLSIPIFIFHHLLVFVLNFMATGSSCPVSLNQAKYINFINLAIVTRAVFQSVFQWPLASELFEYLLKCGFPSSLSNHYIGSLENGFWKLAFLTSFKQILLF